MSDSLPPTSLRARLKNRLENASVKKDDRALAILGNMMAVIGIVLTVIVTYLVIAALFPTFAGAVADVNTNLTNDSVTFGDTTTDGIKPVFAIVIGLAALIGIVGLLLSVFKGGDL